MSKYDDGMSYFNSARDNLLANNINTALEQYHRSYEIFEELLDPEMILKTLNSLGVCSGILGNTQHEVAYFTKGLEACDKFKIKGAKQMFYSNIADRYLMLGDAHSALPYAEMAYNNITNECSEEFTSPAWIIAVEMNLAICYVSTGNFEDGKTHLLSAKENAAKADIHHLDFSILVISMQIALGLGDKQYVLDHLDEVHDIYQRNGETINDYVSSVQRLINIMYEVGKNDEALSFITTVQNDAIKRNDSLLKIEISRIFMQHFKKIGDVERYHNACVQYAEESISQKERQSQQRLMDLDTSIALSTASISTVDFF